VYRIACNYLKTARRSRIEAQDLTFDGFGRELDEGLADRSIVSEPAADESLLLEEVKLGCTLGMLLCLDRDHRLAYILGEMLELDGPGGRHGPRGRPGDLPQAALPRAGRRHGVHDREVRAGESCCRLSVPAPSGGDGAVARRSTRARSSSAPPSFMAIYPDLERESSSSSSSS
jgi:hypothetical protein